MKRLFDIAVATILLLIFAPVIFVVALSIRLEAPGPVLYASPRMGKDGRRFGLLRFRTVDLSKPAYLSMRERLTGVGRFIRNYSLDDLPNLFNVLWGDLSFIGPRATEPERLDLTDPTWQKILTVRPGAFSPAIMLLAQRYNASPNSLKEQLEVEYIQKQSLAYDLHLLRQVLKGAFASRGNWKLRGTPAMAIEYPQFQERLPTAPLTSASTASDCAWILAEWGQPDLCYISEFVQHEGQNWKLSEPYFSLVACGDSIQKPAIFLRTAERHRLWTGAMEWVDTQWLIAESNRYLCLGCILYFDDKAQPASQPRFTYGTLLDVASSSVESWFSIWQNYSETPLFFVREDLQEIRYRFWTKEHDSGVKTEAIDRWQEAKTRLQQSGYALENFVQEAKLLRETLVGSGLDNDITVGNQRTTPSPIR